MANRQDSGSNSAHENQRPSPHNEDAVPELDESMHNRADEDSYDEFEDMEDLDDEEEDSDTDESIS